MRRYRNTLKGDRKGNKSSLFLFILSQEQKENEKSEYNISEIIDMTKVLVDVFDEGLSENTVGYLVYF